MRNETKETEKNERKKNANCKREIDRAIFISFILYLVVFSICPNATVIACLVVRIYVALIVSRQVH